MFNFVFFISQVADQVTEVVNMVVNLVPNVFVAAVTIRDKSCFQHLKRLNELLRNGDNYTFIPLGSKMSSLRNICNDGVHLSEHGVTNLMTTILRFLRGKKTKSKI